MSKQDAIQYLSNRITTDKQFAVSMLAELVYKPVEQIDWDYFKEDTN